MEPFAHVNMLLATLAKRYGIAELRLNDADMAALRLADNTELTFEYVVARGKLFAYVPLREVPPQPATGSAMLACALQLNCMESGVTDALIALDRYGASLLLQIGMPVAGLDVERLDGSLQALLGQIGGIRHRLDAALDAKSAAVPATARSAPSASLLLLKSRPAGQSH